MALTSTIMGMSFIGAGVLIFLYPSFLSTLPEKVAQVGNSKLTTWVNKALSHSASIGGALIGIGIVVAIAGLFS